MNKRTIEIKKPNDSNETWDVVIAFPESISPSYPRKDARHLVSPLEWRQEKDPLHHCLFSLWYGSFKGSRRTQTIFKKWTTDGTLFINGCPFFITAGTRYSINGIKMTVEDMSHALARVTYKSIFDARPETLIPLLFSSADVPEDIKYVLENRLPYYFFDNFERHDVRLNVQQIAKEEYAIEIGDGVWGNISLKDLRELSGFYTKGKKSKNFKYISPQNLYAFLLDKKPSLSDVKVLVAFLKQNRTEDIVEERAEELVADLLRQYENRVHPIIEAKKVVGVYVKGQLFNWKIIVKHEQSEVYTQNVATYVQQHDTDKDEFIWRGPICIDNMNKTPIGDQIASRTLALLNDKMTCKLVSTISHYVNYENKNRMDWNVLCGM